MYLKKNLKSLNHYFSKNSNLLNIISIRAFSYPHKNIKVYFKSKLLNINFSEFIKIYKIKDAIINSKLSCVIKNNVSINSYKEPIIAETIKNSFYFLLLNKFNPKQLNKIKIDRNIKIKNDAYFFDILNDKSNYYHFLIDNYINLIFLLEYYKSNYTIFYNGRISKYINNYMSLLKKVYKKKIIALNNTKFTRFQNNLIVTEPIRYQKVGGFQNLKQKNNTEKKFDPAYQIYNYPLKYKNKKGQTIYNQFISNVTPKSSFDAVDKFLKKLISNKIIKKRKKENIYIARKSALGFKNRIIENENQFFNFLKKKKFKIIYFDNKSAKEQIEIIINSKIVIGIVGANLANIVFKQKNDKVIELFPHQVVRDGIFYNYVSEQRNLNYHRLNCNQNDNGEIIINYENLNKLIELN